MSKDTKAEVDVLDELNKGACMGMDAIKFVLDKVEDDEFHSLLERQYNGYKKISDKICELYPEYSNKEPHETNAMNKVMTWYGIEMKTMFDKSNSKIAELLLQGTNMGIIEGRKLLNHKGTDEEVEKLDGVSVNGKKDHDSAPHIVSVSIEGVRAEVILHTLEDRNIYVSAGSACSSNKPAISSTLQSIGLKKELLDSTVRFSFSIHTTKEELDYALDVMRETIPMLQRYTRH